jgi:hypothetical protein
LQHGNTFLQASGKTEKASEKTNYHKEKRHDLMELADIWEKIANNARLTPGEMDFLKRSGRETQERNAFIAGNTSPTGGLNVFLPFEHIYTRVLTVAAASLTIEIPQDYNHLFCIGSARCTGATYNEYINGTFNGDTGSNYDYNAIAGVNATPGASQTKGDTSFPFGFVQAASSTTGAGGAFFSFMPHIKSGLWKTTLTIGGAPEYSATELAAALGVSHWRSTSPIRTVTVSADSSTIAAGSIFSFFGFR